MLFCSNYVSSSTKRQCATSTFSLENRPTRGLCSQLSSQPDKSRLIAASPLSAQTGANQKRLESVLPSSMRRKVHLVTPLPPPTGISLGSPHSSSVLSRVHISLHILNKILSRIFSAAKTCFVSPIAYVSIS